ncbi:MAG TPA: dienelactone hydrolase family protein [Acidimicrobiales bacterium]|nr:dienelactone hydrolase family protein [Acidimicrobiales bacterium]
MNDPSTTGEERNLADFSNPVQNVAFASNGDEAYGYLALPAAGHGSGLIVIQEWWGLTTHMAYIADRLAGEGFVALAPDLYGGTTTHDEGEALQLLLELPVDRAARDLRGAVHYLLARDEVIGETVGVVGFCMGGAFALQLAVQEGATIAAAVAFYPTGYMPDHYAGLQAAVLIHIGDGDEINPPTLAQELNEQISADTGRKPEIDHYPAGHAFLNEEDLLGTYDAEQARIAWDRTVAFLRAHLT